MNVNPSSEQFGEVVRWDSLTEQQKSSGDWIELPVVDAEPRMARRDRTAPLRRLFEPAKLRAARLGSFDAVGKPR